MSKPLTEKEAKNKYPNYTDFNFIKTEYGTYKFFASPIEYAGTVKSKNKNYYPDKGIKYAYYYELIKLGGIK